MRCDSKTMLKTACVLCVALAVVYFTVPAAHAFVLGSAPVLLALICPVSMLLMMKAMNGQKKEGGTKAENPGAAPRPAEADPEPGMTPTPSRRAADATDRRGVRG